MGVQVALKRDIVTQAEIEGLRALIHSREALKQRLEALEESYHAAQAQLIERLELGAEVHSSFEVTVKAVERRYPAWKQHFVEACGPDAAALVLADTPPTISKSLVIK